MAETYTNTDQERPMNTVVDIIATNIYFQVTNENTDMDFAYPYLVGAPGGGKTASIKSMCRKNGWGCLSTHFALKPLEEISGIPQLCEIKINEKGVEKTKPATEWSMPDIIKELYDMAAKYKVVVWVLDDMHLMSAIHNSIMYELLTERKLRDFHLPKNVGIVLLGNHGHNKAGAKTMFSAVMNRIFLARVYTDFDYWEAAFARPNMLHPAILSFLKNDMYRQFFHMEEQTDSPWCSPRAWTRFANFLSELEKSSNGQSVSPDVVLYLGAGHLGKEAASEFTTYYKIYSRFNLPQILQTADSYQLPSNATDRYALAYALTSHFAGRTDRKEIVKPVAKVILKFIKDYEDLGLVIFHELLSLSACIKNKDDLFTMVTTELNSLDRGVTRRLLQEALAANKFTSSEQGIVTTSVR